MAIPRRFDVVVVGSGPGGAVAAKKCAESGLVTLLLEKKKLPRDKVCSGMIMGAWAHDTISREFGAIPPPVLADPPALAGHRFHVAGADPLTLDQRTPLAWRLDLDYWMLERARMAGVIVREGTALTHVEQHGDLSTIHVRSERVTEALKTRFTIGADGAASPVRRSIFPELKVKYTAPIREFYRGSLSLDRNYIHWFFPKGCARPRFNINHKDDVFLIEGSGIRELRPEIAKTVGPYGFDPRTKPERKDACAIAVLHDRLCAAAFVPASGNTLLVGDAAGLILPITFEGIGTAMRSGAMAAESIYRSVETGLPVDRIYLEKIAPIIETINELTAVQAELVGLRNRNAAETARAILSAYEKTMAVQAPR